MKGKQMESGTVNQASDDEEDELVSHRIIALNSSVSNLRSSKAKNRPSVLTSRQSKEFSSRKPSPPLEVKQVKIQEMKIKCEDSPTHKKALGSSLLPKKQGKKKENQTSEGFYAQAVSSQVEEEVKINKTHMMEVIFDQQLENNDK